MKRTLVLILLIFSSSAFVTPSSSAVMPGDKCSKVGKTAVLSGKSYKCTKVGNSFIWKATKASKNWNTLSSGFINRITTIKDKMLLADNYKDARLFSKSCDLLRIEVGKLPSDTPRTDILQNALSQCTGRSAAFIVAEWLDDKVVRGYPDCANVFFGARYVGTSYSSIWALMQYQVQNLTSEPFDLWSIKTNYPKLMPSASWDGGIPSEKVSQGELVSEVISFGPQQIRNVTIRIDEYKYKEYLAKNVSPFIQEILVDLTSPKYGNGPGYCTQVTGLPKN